MRLSERAMLVSLNAGSWSGQLTDRDVTDEVAESHKAEQGAGKYSKQIVSRKFLHHVNSKISTVRTAHRILTLPWEDGGVRILSTMGYMHYMEQMRLGRHAVEAAAGEFSSHLDDYITEAKQRLGTMFDGNDYPTAERVRAKFWIDVEIKPVPESGDFRTQLSEKTVKAIVADIERRSNDRLEAAIHDIYQRIANMTERMVERLRAYQPAGDGENSQNRFHDSLVYNIQELADLLPSLNITGDKRIDSLREQLKALTDNSPDILRTDARVRARTADKAEAILAKAKKYLG